MNLLKDLEALFPNAEAAVKTVWDGMVADEKYLAALMYGDAKKVAAVVDVGFANLLPAAVSTLKAEALACVTSLNADPAFKNAVGSWKFGTACSMLLRAVESGILPGFSLAGIKTLGTAAIETAIQGAVSGLLVA